MDQLGKSVDTTERSSLKLASENIAPESWENLQTLYVGGGGGGGSLRPPPYKRL